MIAAKPSHAEACATIHSAAFPADEAWPAPAFADMLAMPGVHGLIDRAGGLALVRRVAEEVEILTLATAPEARRRGIARALLAAALRWARRSGATRAFLEVAESNAAARALYEAAGFKPVGLRRRYYADGADALILCVNLDG